MSPDKSPKLRARQEAAIEAFETSVDTLAFEAMVDDYKVSDKVTVSFDDLEMEAGSLPEEIRESHYFPARFTVAAFNASLERFNTTDADDEWMLMTSYTVNGNPYQLCANSDGATLRTSNYEGAELAFSLPVATAGHLLSAIASTQLGIPKENMREYFDSRSDLAADVLANLLKLIGSHDSSAQYMRERLVWLPLLAENRSLIVDYKETESSTGSRRKLNYRLACYIHDLLKAELSASQEDFSTPAGQEQYFSERKGIDFDPDELLIVQQLGTVGPIGEYIDPNLNRSGYAQVSASIKFVLDKYLEGFAWLDKAAAKSDTEESI